MDRDFDPKDGGWFPVMHDLAEKLITTDLTKIESRVLWMFFRYCYGYNKPSCEFQWKDMKDITQLGDGSLSKAINKLKKRNIIQTFHMESKTYVTYRINSKIGSWKTPLSIRKDFPNGKQTLHKRKVNASRMESVPIKDNIKTVKDKLHTSKNNGMDKKALAVLRYLNRKKKSKYRDSTPIVARLKDGCTIQECLAVIDNKFEDDYFKENPRFLNPATLFRKSHWDKYLNDTPPKKNPLAGKVSDVTIKNIETFKRMLTEPE
jgi:phage replication O-like protein O